MTHEDTLPYGHWWACRFPERPLTEETHVWVVCRPCLVALEAFAYQHSDVVVPYYQAGEWKGQIPAKDWRELGAVLNLDLPMIRVVRDENEHTK